MKGLAETLDGLISGLTLVALALALAGLPWALVVRRAAGAAGGGEAEARPALAQAFRLAAWGAGAAAGLGLAEFGVKAWLLAVALERSPFPQFFETVAGVFTLLRSLLAAGFAAAAWRLRRKPEDRAGRIAAWSLAAGVVASGAWLAHGTGRLDDRGLLMAVTVLHQLGAFLWVGGVLHLLGLASSVGRGRVSRTLWLAALRRFAWLGGGAVALLGAGGAVLALFYVGSWSGFAGTGYGATIVAKMALFGLALGFAVHHFRMLRNAGTQARGARPFGSLPYTIEAEALVLVAILFTAAALAALPPAADIVRDRAGLGEVFDVLRPKWPRLVSPDAAEVLKAELAAWAAALPTPAIVRAWNEFNHNLPGLAIVAMGLLALAAPYRPFRWARNWPLGFGALAAFIFVRANEDLWPLGPAPLSSVVESSSSLQHFLGFFMTTALGLAEWRVRATPRAPDRLAYVFPALCAVGGILLLGHSHAAFELKWEFLVQVPHTIMGVLAVALACGRWLEIRLGAAAGRAPGILADLSLVLIGLVLVFYREPAL